MYGNSIQNAIHFHALISEFYNLAPLSDPLVLRKLLTKFVGAIFEKIDEFFMWGQNHDLIVPKNREPIHQSRCGYDNLINIAVSFILRIVKEN